MLKGQTTELIDVNLFSQILRGCIAVLKLEAHLLHASTTAPLGRMLVMGVMVMMMGVGEVHFSSVLLLRLESPFVFSDKFGVGNPSVRAG